ncbi:hypothetical protein LPJ73_001581 [Coemansia sp. RSA 2703]|nr:hypothetical protein LPJ73_001581 [Coemansia sp. RSA 2703]
MVAFHGFGSTSKYCFLCAAPCYVPAVTERPGELTCRDRRHLSNVRLLSATGISHPGLTWRYNESLNAMQCLGYSCPIYPAYDGTPSSCLSVHRACYALLLDRLECTSGTLGSQNLLQRLSPFVDCRGVVRMRAAEGRRRAASDPLPRAPTQEILGLAMCDPTDLPMVIRGGVAMRTAPATLLAADTHANMYHADSLLIPTQLLTPPQSPTDRTSSPTFAFNAAAAPVPVQPTLLHLPAPILTLISSYLRAPEIITLSQTCSALRLYFAAESHVWPQMCRSALGFTPRLLHNHQMAEYYMRVRGDERVERRVLVQRSRIERVIDQIVQSTLVGFSY